MELLDCVIIGGGPAGLTAAIYLARFCRNFAIFDTGKSRANLIPRSFNYPGYKNGISGKNILKKLKEQVSQYAIEIYKEQVIALEKENVFIIQTPSQKLYAKTVLVATGIVDIEPDLPNIPNAIERGLLRHCPICDIYEVRNKRIAVLAQDEKGFQTALFIRHFSAQVSLLTLGKKLHLTRDNKDKLHSNNIVLLENSLKKIVLKKNDIGTIYLKDFIEPLKFDTIYSALGTKNNNELALHLGAKTQKGALIVDKHQETSIKGLYAAGDIVSDLNQLSVAQGQAAIAATAIHNAL
ncbi:thioredoxin reductase (plasmid) [Legionella adelaidensis]|uniref:Thioredoxin reductase n=1 Tax=Legionella adelaidensis TaxID=45056 RepID=A0A0W0R427_9GAMM|nr:NAD(P)/FAD-dependent oxidoreductase [Legionella adelaidensis]KTC65830.1 thioredoxin reductase [Legionella adelaidensis]VEH85260.1 thioredoxin reductase [Legionella adelaidensis]